MANFWNISSAIALGASQSIRRNAWNTDFEAFTPSEWGTGDVVWPGSSTDNAIARFDSTTGKLIQNSSATVDDSGNVSIAGLTTTGTIELGNATDTTISRVSAGVIAVEGVTVPTISSTSTLTDKRITKRVVSTTQSATPTINTDNGDIFTITGLAQAITSFTTNLSGTPVAGDMIMIQITDDGTARALTFWASFSATTVALPTTTVISTLLRVLFQWNGSTWACIASV